MDNPEQQITIIGEANHRNRLRKFGIKQDDRRRHMYIIGKTGMGKSVLMENLAVSDVHAGHGMCYIDPHGDGAETILEYIPPHRINDVIYFNPADLDNPVAFNILESIDPKYKHLVASGLVAVFKKMWADSWGPRLEYILRNAILALLDFPSATLLGIPRMLTDKQYRRKVVAKITDPVVKSFWVDEFENYNERMAVEAISPIQNKVGQFLSSSVIRNIIGQAKSTIDLNEAMNNNKILILNLSKGKLGEDNASLLGAMMITKVQLAAMQRAEIPEEERKDFYLYVDEFQNFATEAFASILSEARKYRLNLIIAHQYIAQMVEEVADAVFGNVGTMIAFRVGAADGEVLEKEFEPVFMMNDFVNLKKYNIYLKLMVDGVATRAFSAQTLPIIYEQYNQSDKVIAVSRERYAKTRAEVEEKIMRWSGVEVIPAAQPAPVEPQFDQQQPLAQPAPEQHQVSTQNQMQFAPQSAQQAQVSPEQPQGMMPEQQPQSVQQQPVGGVQHFEPAPQQPTQPQESPEPEQEQTQTQTPAQQAPSTISLPRQRKSDSDEKAGSSSGKKPVDDNRPMHKTQCDECEIPIEVPFVPDGSRPVLCQDCLPEYRSRMAKIENQRKAETGEDDKPKQEQKSSNQQAKSERKNDGEGKRDERRSLGDRRSDGQPGRQGNKPRRRRGRNRRGGGGGSREQSQGSGQKRSQSSSGEKERSKPAQQIGGESKKDDGGRVKTGSGQPVHF